MYHSIEYMESLSYNVIVYEQLQDMMNFITL